MTNTFERELLPVNKSYSYSRHVIVAVLSCIFVYGMLSAFHLTWGSNGIGLLKLAAPAAIGIAAVIAYSILAERRTSRIRIYGAVFGCVILLSLAVAVFVPGIAEISAGMKLWVNMLIVSWNSIHDSGYALLEANATAADAEAFSVLVSYAAGLLIAYQFCKRKVYLTGNLCGAVLLLQLLCGRFSALGSACMLSAYGGLVISGRLGMPRCARRLWLIFTALLTISAISVQNSGMRLADELREGIQTGVHELRYGVDTLPLGNLYKASQLHESDAAMMTVKTGQAKNIYLRGFVGSEYAEGHWSEPKSSVYSGNYRGMLDWLRADGFDPLTQSAEYYALCDAAAAPEENKLIINASGASRFFIYAPDSCGELKGQRISYKHDLRMKSRSLSGERVYTMTEYSGSRPEELNVAEPWIAEPDTPERKAYAQAEAVYRSFVYDTYTKLPDRLRQMSDKLLWDDFDDKNDSIYGLLHHVRIKLVALAEYSEAPEPAPEGEDPIAWAFENSHEANAVLYASAAAAALRAKDIPARYVEGYLITADKAADDNGTAELTGKDAHAWVEVYFDGMGWRPVDVTPGYYFNAVDLQQMVGMPEDVQKTAALDESGNGADKVSENGNTGSRFNQDADTAKEAAKNAALILSGIAALLLILAAAVIAVLELVRIFVMIYLRRSYVRADSAGKADILAVLITNVMASIGIEVHPGWNAKETAEQLAQRMEGIEAEEYERVNAIIEKQVYGGIEPKPYELRTLEAFAADILKQRSSDSRLTRIRLRYKRLIIYCCEMLKHSSEKTSVKK